MCGVFSRVKTPRPYLYAFERSSSTSRERYVYKRFAPCDGDTLLLSSAEAGAPLTNPRLIAVCYTSTPGHQDADEESKTRVSISVDRCSAN